MVSIPPVSYELALKRGIAQELHDLNLGVYKPTDPYAASERGIFTGGDLSITVYDLILLSVAPFSRTSRTTGFCAVQLFIRMTGETTVAENLAGQIRDTFEGRTHMRLGDNGEIGIREVTFLSGLPMSKDTAGRGSYSLNLLFHGRKPITNSPQLG